MELSLAVLFAGANLTLTALGVKQSKGATVVLRPWREWFLSHLSLISLNVDVFWAPEAAQAVADVVSGCGVVLAAGAWDDNVDGLATASVRLLRHISAVLPKRAPELGSKLAALASVLVKDVVGQVG